MAAKKGKKTIKVQDLKPKKDAKGGVNPSGPGDHGPGAHIPRPHGPHGH